MTIFPDAVCQQARLSRDARFDGLFFVGVLSTGIYCRPICPAVAPKEANVQYFSSAAAAAQAGLRPCLRCRPESAPGSNAWLGTDTTLKRAVSLLEQAALDSSQTLDIERLCQRLGISARWLRTLFADKLGMTPKKYANYCRLLLAKQLLHQTQLPITDIAYAAGFTSVRRFNEVFVQQLQLTPSALRASSKTSRTNGIELTLSYRPPYDWQALCDFYRVRAVAGMEWFSQADQCGYGRTILINRPHDRPNSASKPQPDYLAASFFATQNAAKNCLNITIELADNANIRLLPTLIHHIRRILDVDAEPAAIMATLQPLAQLAAEVHLAPGTRIAGVPSVFEAGIRAVLGQQVSVKQAINLLNQLVQRTGVWRAIGGQQRLFFPTATELLQHTLQLPMPAARNQTLRLLSEHCAAQEQTTQGDDAAYGVNPAAATPDAWLKLKGIGPWTVAYAKMRGQSWPDVLLSSDLVIKKQLKPLMAATDTVHFEQWLSEQASPWGSYLTFMLWRNA